MELRAKASSTQLLPGQTLNMSNVPAPTVAYTNHMLMGMCCTHKREPRKGTPLQCLCTPLPQFPSSGTWATPWMTLNSSSTLTMLLWLEKSPNFKTGGITSTKLTQNMAIGMPQKHGWSHAKERRRSGLWEHRSESNCPRQTIPGNTPGHEEYTEAFVSATCSGQQN